MSSTSVSGGKLIGAAFVGYVVAKITSSPSTTFVSINEEEKKKHRAPKSLRKRMISLEEKVQEQQDVIDTLEQILSKGINAKIGSSSIHIDGKDIKTIESFIEKYFHDDTSVDKKIIK